jgi:iron(III) transport system substrate-binding protein
VPLALTVYSWIPEQQKLKDAPVENWPIAPLLAQPSTIAMLKRSPNPASALLFYDFMLSEGQQLLAQAKYVPTSKKIESPLVNASLKFIDPVRALDMQDKWLKKFDEMIVKKSK